MKHRAFIRPLMSVFLLAPLAPIHAQPAATPDGPVDRLGSEVAIDASPDTQTGRVHFVRPIDKHAAPLIHVDKPSHDIAEKTQHDTDASALSTPLQIGQGIAVPDPRIDAARINWKRLDIGWVGHFDIRANGAETLRAALRIAVPEGGKPLSDSMAEKIVFHFSGNDDQVFEVSAKQIIENDNFWTALTSGDVIHVEVVTPAAIPPASIALRVERLSHFKENAQKNRYSQGFYSAGWCQRDVVCRPKSAVLRQAAKSVAKMVYTKPNGKSYVCTGTLLNNRNVPKRPLFLTAKHCIPTQSEASSLTTIWFYQTTTCGGAPASVDERVVQLSGGSTLLSAHAVLDSVLLQLNNPPPAGAHYQGWSTAQLVRDEPLQAIHHPRGDAKKHSIGIVSDTGLAGWTQDAARIKVQWGEADDAGVAESGSSGSGIFTAGNDDLAIRGTLKGGPAACGKWMGERHDYYAPFSDFYPSVSHYFNASR